MVRHHRQALAAALFVAGLSAACSSRHAATPDATRARAATAPDASAPPALDAQVAAPEALDGATFADAALSADALTDAAPADAAPPPRRVTITASGDLLLHPRVTDAAMAHVREGRLVWTFALMAPIITSREVAIADLEAPLASHYRTAPGTGPRPILGAPVAFARDLARVGFDALLLATNHVYDQGAAGLADTLDALRSAGIEPVGAGHGEAEAFGPRVITREGVRVALLGYTTGTDQGPGDNAQDVRVGRIADPARALAAVRAARDEADVVVVAVHWSHDFLPGVDNDVRALARRLVDAGADLVLGSGPHLLQRVERMPSRRGEAVVVYSLGNLVSNQGEAFHFDRPVPPHPTPAQNPATRDGVLLRTTFELGAAPDAPIRVASIGATGLWTRVREGELRVVPLRALDAAERASRLSAISAALGPAVRVRP